MSEERKIVERIHVDLLREMIWKGKGADYMKGWRWYSARAFGGKAVLPDKRSGKWYEGAHDARNFADAFYTGTAKIVKGEEKPPKEPEPPEELDGNELKAFLKRSKMPQKEFAKKMGVSQGTVSGIVTGRMALPKGRQEAFKTIVKEWEEKNG